MKRYGKLYEQIIAVDNIELAINKAMQRRIALYWHHNESKREICNNTIKMALKKPPSPY